MQPYTRNVNRFIYLQTQGTHDNIYLCGLQLFSFLEYRGSQECITLVKFNSTLWEDYELDIPESCIFPYWRNNKPANGNTQQTTHCSGKKTCKLFKIHKTQHALLAKYLANWYAINMVCSTTLTSNLVSTTIKGSCHLRFSGFCPLRGYPPPTPLTENQCEKKKVFFLSGKQGVPPPP